MTSFIPFKEKFSTIELPERFTFPFCYEPHSISLLAVSELQKTIEHHEMLNHALSQIGKMFGVLVVMSSDGTLGYLTAFSGKLMGDEALLSHFNFVPDIVTYDVQQSDFIFENNRLSQIINQINAELATLQANPKITILQEKLVTLTQEQDDELDRFRQEMANNRQMRKTKRIQAKETFASDDLALCLKQLAQESVADKNKLKSLKNAWMRCIKQKTAELSRLTDGIDDLKNKRKRLSTKLQKKLFKQYRLLNALGEEKDLMAIFEKTPHPMPPAGAGDCAAPKLLQYAFKHQLKPIAMAEFWWGKSPKSEIRQHKNFYAACSSKCQPILTHMLAGIELEDNPLLINSAQDKPLTIVYQDHDMVVVNKPHELLSVPGKHIQDCVYTRIKQQFPQATGSLIVHRLDMSTSGVMVLALTKRAQKNLQQQFIKRQVKKRYVALLEGNVEKSITKTEGEINLPLRGDFNDRPRQMVCFDHGKHARTQWQVIEVINGKSKLFLYPETGRTHQLRVHCSHSLGLNLPILGDDLYGTLEGKKAPRLHLHAQRLTLSHPITKERMTFEVAVDFCGQN